MIGNYNLLATQASPDGEEVTDEVLNQILATYQNTLKSSREKCNAYVHKLCKAGNLSMAIRLLSCAKTNDCTALIRYVKQVSELAFLSNTTVINLIIFAFAECRAGLVDEMVHEFTSMKEAGFVPDFVTYNTLLNNLRKVGRLEMCLMFFREMSDSGVESDLLTYRAMIEIFGRSGNTEEALRLFSEMKQRQIRPSIYIYRSLIDILKKAGKVELAISFLKEMNSSLSDLAGPEDFKRKRILGMRSRGKQCQRPSLNHGQYMVQTG
ncbi:hypothetical protein CRYUN_Cryun06bG0089900 [Craigia yunnanensis]